MKARPKRERQVSATFAHRHVAPDPAFETQFAEQLRTEPLEVRLGIYDRFAHGQAAFDGRMRRIALRSLVRSMGDGVTVEPGVLFKHPETFEIGEGVFLGAGAFLQGRHDGTCRIGRRCWIGPGAYLDARDVVLEEYVGWGPGARLLGSMHTGEPLNVPVVETDLVIAPVRVGRWADVGTGAVILPGVTIGEGALVGAGAVVSRDVEAYAVVAGVPARRLRSRRAR